jgi:hypothetical protein
MNIDEKIKTNTLDHINHGRLYDKYIIEKANGEPIDPNADYFVLRLDTDLHARTAAMAYANSIENENPAFARDIRDRLWSYRKKSE